MRNRLIQIDELHKFSDGTLTDVRTALDDRLKGIRMQYLPQSIWRKSDKDRAAAMIQAIDKRLKTRRIMRSLERSILTDLQVTPTKPGRMTKLYSSHRFIANCFNVRNLKMEGEIVRYMKSIGLSIEISLSRRKLIGPEEGPRPRWTPLKPIEAGPIGVENGVIELYFVNTEYQLADLFTKALGRDRIEFLTNKLGMRSFTPETLKQLINEEEE
nr:ribonuclease H [Tanacetum cinerariifolium]